MLSTVFFAIVIAAGLAGLLYVIETFRSNKIERLLNEVLNMTSFDAKLENMIDLVFNHRSAFESSVLIKADNLKRVSESFDLIEDHTLDLKSGKSTKGNAWYRNQRENKMISKVKYDELKRERYNEILDKQVCDLRDAITINIVLRNKTAVKKAAGIFVCALAAFAILRIL